MIDATSGGTPRLRSTKRRTAGPSFSRKNVENAVKVRKKTSDVISLIPFATPWRSALPVCAVDDLTSAAVDEVPPAPASLNQPSILSTAWLADALISDDCS